MPRYHFHAQEGDLYPDREGVELTDDEAARVTSLPVLGELIIEQPQLFWHTRALQLRVTDARDLTLFVLDLGVVVSPTNGRGKGSRAQ